MLLIRRFEEKAGQMYGMGLIGGFCHLYIGQEAVVVGMRRRHHKDDDSVITSYRDHGHMLACGMDPKGVMAELTGRAGGYSKGKGGSMHMFSREKGFYGGHGIVGAQVPLGTGIAFAHKYRDEERGQPDLSGRRRGQPGSGLRGLQHGGVVGSAGDLRDREQQVRHGHLHRAFLGAHRSLSSRPGLRHPGQPGRRHGRAGGQGGRRQGRGPRARRQGPLHSGDDDLPLPRPLDVGSRPSTVPARKRSRKPARSATRSSACAPPCSNAGSSRRPRSRPSTGTSRRWSPRPPTSPRKVPSRNRPSSTPTFSPDRRAPGEISRPCRFRFSCRRCRRP